MPKSADGGGALTPSPFVHAETSSIIIFQVTMEYFGNGSAHGPSIPAKFVENHDPFLVLLVRIGGTLSVVGSIFFIVSYCIFRRSRTFSRRLLLYLTIADLMASVGWLLSGFEKILNAKHPGALCVIQGYLLQFFYLASFLWTSCFAWHLFQIAWLANGHAYKLEWRYHLLSWGVPGGVCIYFAVRQLFFHEPGMGGTKDRPWCWITTNNPKDKFEWEQFVFFYFPLVAILIFNLFIYLLLLKRMKYNLSAMQLHSELKIKQRLLLYVGVFIFLSGWGLVNRVYQFLSPSGTPNYFLLCMDAICGPLQGFCNAIVYGINQKLRKRYIECCSRKLQGTDGSADYEKLKEDYDFKYANYGSGMDTAHYHESQRQSLPNSPGI